MDFDIFQTDECNCKKVGFFCVNAFSMVALQAWVDELQDMVVGF